MKTRLLKLVFAFCAAVLLALALSCGGSGQSSVLSPQSSDNTWGPSASTPGVLPGSAGAPALESDSPPATTLEESIAELDALPTPEGVDPAVFSTLKEALREALVQTVGARHAVPPRNFKPQTSNLEPAKLASRAPAGESNRVNNLAVTDNGGGACTLTWDYRNCGDYNQDGLVSIMDITPLAAHFNEEAATESEWIDGNTDGAINIADITPLAAGFLCECAGYRVEGATTGGSFSEIALIGFQQAGGTHRLRFQHTFAYGESRRFHVIPLDSAGAEGLPSNEVSVNPTPPSIVSVNPTTGTEGTQVTFSAVVNGTQPFTYSWDFGGGATPDTSSLADPLVTLGAIGVYECTLAVSNALGNDTFLFTLTVEEAQQTEPLELWFYLMKNLYVDANVLWAIDLVQRAADAGYTKVVLADYKLGVIDLYGQDYYDNLQEFVQAARDAGVEVIPSLVPIGYSDAFLQHNPNLIEAQPVHDALFEVSGTTADIVQEPATTIVNGGFENHSGDTFTGWNQMDGAGVSTFADTGTIHGDATSIRFENFPAGNPTGNDRIRQQITVKPWQCYAVSFWLKTDAAVPSGSIWFRVFREDFSGMLTFLETAVNSTQDWKQYFLIFNSQNETEVHLYMGIWGGQSGRFWIDDVSVENTGLINLVRRPGAPVTVTSEDGATTYTEGLDYEYIEDPLMGHVSWPGTYDLYHARPTVTITPGSRIHNGDRLLVSYYHCVFVYDMQPAVCLSENETYDIITDTLAKVEELIHPEGVFIAVDELRVVNWDEACQSRGMTPGELLADTTQRIEQIARDINPAWTLFTWSDMYDPYHNARDDYYLANGTLAGSWDGLPSTWDIGNWRHFGDREETLAFFADRGHRQVLAGFYDEAGPDFTIDDWLTDAKDYEGVYAVMYTTWREDFDHLEAWAQTVRDWEAANR